MAAIFNSKMTPYGVQFPVVRGLKIFILCYSNHRLFLSFRFLCIGMIVAFFPHGSDSSSFRRFIEEF